MNQSFDTAAQPIGKGHKPVVPEPANYGLVFLIITLVIIGHYLARRRK